MTTIEDVNFETDPDLELARYKNLFALDLASDKAEDKINSVLNLYKKVKMWQYRIKKVKRLAQERSNKCVGD
jgi:hypothetical protein